MAQSLPQDPAQLPSPGSAHRRFNPRLLLPGGVILAGVGVAFYLNSRPQSNTVVMSGRIEGYETDVGAKTPGRIKSVGPREGDTVRKGQLLVEIDDAEVQAQLRGANARLTAAQELERQASLQIDVVRRQIQEAQFSLQQSEGDASGRIQQAQANVAAVRAQLAQAQAQLKQSQAELELARVNRDRYARLVRDGAITQQQLDQAQTIQSTAQATVEARQAAVAAAAEQLRASQGGLVQVQTTGFNPEIRNSQLEALQIQLVRAQSQWDAAQAEVANARAARQQILAQIDYLNITSPIDGVVTTRSVEPGAVVTSGKTLLTVIDPNTVYLRGFIPQADVNKIRVGQPAKVLLASQPGQPATTFQGQIAQVDPQASFTPENIYFEKDQVRQVFGVKITIAKPGGLAKPGMSAKAEIQPSQESQQ